MRTLYISYFGALKHLSQTQVIPYLKGLADTGIGVTLLSFEERVPDPRAEVRLRRSLREELAGAGLSWVPLRYHKRPSLAATGWDVMVGLVVGSYVVLRSRIDVVHARNHVPAVVALVLKCLFGCRMVFDLRGTMAEEYVDAGLWRKHGIAYRITKRVERAALLDADAVIMLTNRVRERLFRELPELAAQAEKVRVIPCCVDLSRYSAASRAVTPESLGVPDARVMVYVGNLGGWYLTEAMARLFRVAREIEPRLHFLVLTQDPAAAESALLDEGLSPRAFTIRTVRPSEIPSYLAAAEFGLCLLKPSLSKESSSPTKIGEYLASGLPILANRGTGDIDALIEGRRLGILLDNFETEDYRDGIRRMLAIVDSDPDLPRRCREAAAEEYDLAKVGIPRYLELYRRLLATPRRGDAVVHDR